MNTKVKIKEITTFLNGIVPEDWALSFDNPGLLTGWTENELTGIHICLDLTQKDIEEAEREGCNLIVTHHPTPFHSVKNFTLDNPDSALPLECARRGISHYAMHTNLDRAIGGVNDALAEALGLTVIDILPDTDEESQSAPRGLTRLCSTDNALTLEELALHTAKVLGINSIEYVGEASKPVKTIAVCGGAGGEFAPLALEYGADVLITGEARHHERLIADRLGIGLIIGGHYETEMFVLDKLRGTLQNHLNDIKCNVPVFCSDKNAPTKRAILR